jgi:hypothetical protein
VLSNAALAVGTAGALVLLAVLVDIFVTIFAYDGFTFLAPRYHRLLWRTLRTVSRPLPERARHAVLSLGSAAMLPATLSLWLGMQTVAFAMIYLPGLGSGAFAVAPHAGTGFGSALYLSGGDLTSLTFGDLVPRGGLYRAAVDIQTMIGLATFTLGLTYVLTAFDAMGQLNSLYARVRRNALEPNRPSTILIRRDRGGDGSQLSSFLQSLVEELEAYGEGLRRFPVAFYFHTRRVDRSTPRIFAALGDLIELVRWGLPAACPPVRDPSLLALIDGYRSTVDRLQRSFVGPAELPPPDVPDLGSFQTERATGIGRPAAFAALQAEARAASGLADEAAEADQEAYRRFTEWLVFHHHREVFLARVSAALGYS